MENPLQINKNLFYDIEKGLGTNTSDIPLEVLASQPDIIRGLNFLFIEAVKLKASDIHLEPFKNHYKIRFRIDGILNDVQSSSIATGNGLISRIKVMARLNISDRECPQDGRFKINTNNESVELRVSVIPMLFGEGVVLRILDRSVVNLDLANIGINEPELKIIRESMYQTNGVILMTGPTGSGKTTSLYAMLSELNRDNIRIVTTEDPVEYEINGAMQVEINPEIGLTFASSLRSILRQDPDIILVGEIRDTETANTAIEASLTGHMILSTIHTRNTVSTISRLVDMGVASYLLADTINLIVAQRLVRVICEQCKEKYQATQDEINALDINWQLVVGNKQVTSNDQLTFYHGKGCNKCSYTGYKGRIGIYEVLKITDEEREYITNMDITESLYRLVREKGMLSLREQGVKKMLIGKTTFNEVMENT